jgi:hypothetical protein
MALILSIFANFRCNLVQPNYFGGSPPAGFDNVPDSVGLWCYEVNNGVYYEVITSYDARDINIDSKYDAARAMGLTTIVLGICIVVFYTIAGCVHLSPKAFMLVDVLGTVTCLFQGLFGVQVETLRFGMQFGYGWQMRHLGLCLLVYRGQDEPCGPGKERAQRRSEFNACSHRRR